MTGTTDKLFISDVNGYFRSLTHKYTYYVLLSTASESTTTFYRVVIDE